MAEKEAVLFVCEKHAELNLVMAADETTIVNGKLLKVKPKYVTFIRGPFGGEYKTSDAKVIEFIKAHLNDGILPETHEKREHLSSGDEVMILSGAFDQFIGLVDVQVEERVRVLLDLFGRSTATIVARDSVAAVVRPS